MCGLRSPLSLGRLYRQTLPPENQRGGWRDQPGEMVGNAQDLDTWRRAVGRQDKESAVDTNGAAWTKRWDQCDAGSIRLTLGPGGRKRPKDWAERVPNQFAEFPD